MSGTSLKGRLLVANPVMPDPNFYRTIVFVLAHEDSGALGIILNRPTSITVSDAATGWGDLAADPPVVFSGGPVEPSAAICLAEAAGFRSGHSAGSGAEETSRTSGGGRWSPVLGSVGTFDLSEPGEIGDTVVERLRVFSGYAGWGAGQLEAELSAGGWFVVEADPQDLLSPRPAMLWRRVLHRQPGVLSAISSYPTDPSVN